MEELLLMLLPVDWMERFLWDDDDVEGLWCIVGGTLLLLL